MTTTCGLRVKEGTDRHLISYQVHGKLSRKWGKTLTSLWLTSSFLKSGQAPKGQVENLFLMFVFLQPSSGLDTQPVPRKELWMRFRSSSTALKVKANLPHSCNDVWRVCWESVPLSVSFTADGLSTIANTGQTGLFLSRWSGTPTLSGNSPNVLLCLPLALISFNSSLPYFLPISFLPSPQASSSHCS